MIFFDIKEILMMLMIAILLDWMIGDPRWIKHPVTIMGAFIKWLEQKLYLQAVANDRAHKIRGLLLLFAVSGISFLFMWMVICFATMIHPWVGYVLNTWFISTAIACKGLKDAALQVYHPLIKQDLKAARYAVSMIVGRDTEHLDEPEVVRATVETVAENTVDAFISPIIFAFIGGASLAIFYRAVNTLDSMVGYKNTKYIHFGWASARCDDWCNWIPARLTGWLLSFIALQKYGNVIFLRTLRSIRTFAHLHPSPNSGIPESAVAGAIGVELGGNNQYGEITSQRAKMGWPLQMLQAKHILEVNAMLYWVSYYVFGGFLCLLLCWLLFNF
jgi:adenosylcobinamide-phosphate synthase